ncbi:UvrD-helicase domain-containing protein [Methylobacterium sp. Gmos1]
MDAFETIRRQAASIHREAVEGGANPWQPLALVTAAVGLRVPNLWWLAPGDPLLRCGRGLYDPELDAVICVDQGGDADRALLAAHELGHAVVHKPADVIVDHEIDPSRPVEAGASGVEKVVDYGRRERRELQADLFARELVLPRERVRDLFLRDGLGAYAIAERMELPYALVAEQLFDALLLPEQVEAVKPAAKRPTDLDGSQGDAATHEGSPCLLQAGPGTGKTRTLVARIGHLLDTGVDPRHLLILTFSNKAAGELVERVAAVWPEAAAGMWIGTFHGFGLDLLRRFHDRDKLPDDPRLVDKADAVDLLEDLLPGLTLRHFRNLHDPTLDVAEILSAISRAKDEVCGVPEYRAFARAMRERSPVDEAARIRAEKACEAADVYEVYDREMRRTDRLDFGDLVMRAALLVERDPEALALLRDRHRHVLVDEYQDVNRASVRLLKALAGSGERLWAVGDSRQSVYRFRGASSASMAEFANDFPGATVRALKVNYRSTGEVVDAFSTFADGMLASRGVLPLDLEARNGCSGHAPELRTADHPEDELRAVADRILELREAGVPFRDQAVLCRGNRRLGEIATALTEREVPVLFLGNLFERDEVRDLLALLSLVVDQKAASLPRVAMEERYAMSLTDLDEVQGHASRCRHPLEWLSTAPEVAPGATDALRVLAGDLEGFGPDAYPWHVLTRLLLDRTDLLRRLVLSDRPSDRLRGVALWQFLAFCRALPEGRGLPIERLLARVRRLVLLSEERDLRHMPAAAGAMDAVSLLTVHASKGLEFEAVHVPGMVVTSIPAKVMTPRCPPPDGMIAGMEHLTGIDAVKAGHDAEEECLFFVALSRARVHLTLYAASRQSNGNRREPSPFLPRIESRLRRVAAAPFGDVVAGDDAGRVPITWSAPPEFSAEAFALFDKCPRRFLYTHVLGVAGGRRSTDYVRMHDVVYEVMRWIRAEPERWHLAKAAVEAKFDEAWLEKGPTANGYADDYRRAGLGLIRALMRSREGHGHGGGASVTLDLGGLRVIVTPDEVRGDGAGVAFRRVRTGRRSSEEEDGIVYGLYEIAARRRLGGRASVEAIHLSEPEGEMVMRLDLGERKVANREKKALGHAERILAGEFPRKANDRTCPRCPHYFVCGPVPAGTLPR